MHVKTRTRDSMAGVSPPFTNSVQCASQLLRSRDRRPYASRSSGRDMCAVLVKLDNSEIAVLARQRAPTAYASTGC